MQPGDVYEQFTMHTSDDKFIIQPTGTDVGNECLIIDRVTQDISVRANPNIPLNAIAKKIFGIFGIIRLVAGPYLIVVTNRELAGVINNRNIFRVVATEMYPFNIATFHLSELHLADNRVLVEMVKTVLDFKSYYFATDFDITHSLQRLADKEPPFFRTPLYERADQRFVWNGFMLRGLAVIPEAFRFTLPIMLGFVETRDCVVADKAFKLALISRQSSRRAGVRFQRRGIDAEGHAANFAETEQILEYGDIICSFVQTRGSVPIYWSQKPNLHLQPYPRIKAEDHLAGFLRHMQQQVILYGHQIIVSLVGLSGHESIVASVLKNLMSNNSPQQIKLVEFDFQKEGHHRLTYLVYEILAADCDRNGYFAMRRDEQDSRCIKQQSGVFRTSCIDCLDRTNVVQSMVAKRILDQQLRWLRILVGDDNSSHYFNFDSHYKNLWADNGDTCSMQYAGTCGLKGDVARTGKRTHIGEWNDFKNVITRWYMNNFYDGYRQDSIDLCLGNVFVHENWTAGTFGFRWTWPASVVLGLVATIGMFVLTFLFATEHRGIYMIFWNHLSIVLTFMIYFLGEQFVNKPILKRD